jgi:DNA-binding CsgD family transcriptional regulator/tetratricopeptide (TPR) repeat protein
MDEHSRSVPLPGPLRLPSSLPFVGRWDQLAALAAAQAEAAAGARRVVLVGGEAGSGKSRIVREFARAAYDDGAAVLHGACDPVVRTPYGPFVEALDHLVRFAPPDRLRAVIGPAPGELTRLLPELPARIGALAAPMPADQDTERYRLYSAVSDLLAGISTVRPLVLVLEDGHWADTPSLLLLRHVARSVDARLLVVATFRDTEAEVPADLSDTLVDLRRSDGVVRIRVGGLTEADVLDFVGRASGAHVDQAARELAEEIARLTQGNAFLVCELWQSLVETGSVVTEDGRLRLIRPPADIATPEGVRELASQRLHRLDDATTELLEVGAVAGPEFTLGNVRAATGQADEELLGAVERARASGMIEEIPGRSLDYRFTHELVRRAVYDRLPAHRRATLHLRIGEAMDAAGTGRASDLAHHFTAALPLTGGERAVDNNLQAAAAATASLAFDEAADHLRAALDLGIADDRRRAEALLELGNACVRSGAAPDAMDAYRQVAEAARQESDGNLLAMAAIGFEAASWRPRTMEDVATQLLEEALELLPDEDSQRRVEVLASLVRPLGIGGQLERSRQTLDDAVAAARRLGDPTTLARTLVQAHFTRGAVLAADILAMLAEAQVLADQVGEVEVDAQARLWRCIILIGSGGLEQARRELVSQGAAAYRARQPFINYINEYLGSTLALCTGHLEAAAAAAERANDWGRHLRGGDVSVNYGIQMFGVRREQGRLAEVAPVVRVLAGTGAVGGPWRAGMAAILAELGMAEDALDMLARIRAEGFESAAAGTRLTAVIYAADAAAAVGDARMASLLYDELAPLAGTNLVIGQGVTCYGAADRYLGMLALTAGELELAAGHLASGVQLNREMGAATWLAHSLYQHGRVFSRLDNPQATGTLAEAEALAEAIGMPSLLARIRSVGLPRPPRALPDGLSPREVEILRLVAGGLSNRQIGERLAISEHTAANHIRSILRKTGCGNRTQAASYAFRQGLAADSPEPSV